MLGILLGLFLLSVIVLIHELGHFAAARWFKVPVETFSVGFGRAIVSRTWGDTTYQLAWVPLGGYVKFKDKPPIESQDQAGSLPNLDKPPSFGFLGRTSMLGASIILLGGILANFLLSWLALVSAFLLNGRSLLESLWGGLVFLGAAFKLTVLALPHAFIATFSSDTTDEGFSGPVGIVDLIAEQSQSFTYVLLLIAAISFGLGFVNLLPLPLLDGGHLVLGIIEHIRQRTFEHRTVLIINSVGAVLLVSLIVFVTMNDINRLLA